MTRDKMDSHKHRPRSYEKRSRTIKKS
jgi:hypothetical protein